MASIPPEKAFIILRNSFGVNRFSSSFVVLCLISETDDLEFSLKGAKGEVLLLQFCDQLLLFDADSGRHIGQIVVIMITN